MAVQCQTPGRISSMAAFYTHLRKYHWAGADARHRPRGDEPPPPPAAAMTVEAPAKLSAKRVAREIAAAYRAHWRFLIAAAVIILLPQALADALLDHAQVEGVHN